MPIISIPNSPKATGGDVRTIHLSGTNYVMHVFEDSGFFVAPADITGCTVVVVGGGGSGGASYGDNDTGEGGGGAGGLLFRDNFTISAGTYECGIGRGGYHIMQKGHGAASSYGGNFGWSGSGENGNDTCLNKSTSSGTTLDVIARGGGGGGASDMHGAALIGGSGGGGGARNSTSSWLNGQASNQASFTNWTHRGNSGGNSANGNYGGGGGGGAGAAGSNHTGSVNYGTGGDGGVGYDYSSYFGTLVGDRGWFAGGGGGGTYRKADLPAAGTAFTDYLGIGGKGGGGNGIYAEEHSDGNTFKHQKMDGMRGTGGGGGGSGEDAVSRISIGADTRTGCKVGTGGSGVIIIRYAQ
jgi:hypothetical protein